MISPEQRQDVWTKQEKEIEGCIPLTIGITNYHYFYQCTFEHTTNIRIYVFPINALQGFWMNKINGIDHFVGQINQIGINKNLTRNKSTFCDWRSERSDWLSTIKIRQ
jgi:hypothetical protein